MCFKKLIRWALKPTNIEERMIKMNALKETVRK